MLKQYIKQAWRVLRDNPVLSTISILGTALAIAMIMVLVMTHQVKNAPYPPEVHRHRTLYVKTASAINKENEQSVNNGAVGSKFAYEALKTLQSAEAVALYEGYAHLALFSLPGEKKGRNFDIKMVDDAFWRVFSFDFIAGMPFTLADVEGKSKKAVISERVAREIFNTTNVEGKTIMINYTEYQVTGVVKDVSTLCQSAYSQAWTPYDPELLPLDSEPEGICGISHVAILAHSPKDFEKIRIEVDKNIERYNAGLENNYADLRGQPDTQYVSNNRESSNEAPNMKYIKKQAFILLTLLLLVPAINLSGITSSRMRKRMSEIGLRRSLGATRGQVLHQVMVESLVQTLIGGAIGLLLAFGASYLFKSIFINYFAIGYYAGDLSINPFSLLSPWIFLMALLVCLLLNLISALIPAWNVSRSDIVQSLHSR